MCRPNETESVNLYCACGAVVDGDLEFPDGSGVCCCDCYADCEADFAQDAAAWYKERQALANMYEYASVGGAANWRYQCSWVRFSITFVMCGFCRS